MTLDVFKVNFTDCAMVNFVGFLRGGCSRGGVTGEP